MAETTHRNIVLPGPPAFPEAARVFDREIQRNLGLDPIADPFLPRSRS